MAEGVVSVVLSKLYEVIEQEAHLLGGVSRDVRLLRDKLKWISLSLKEADDKCLEDKHIKLWVSEVRAAAFDAEDIIDKFILSVRLPHRRASLTNLLRNPINRWIALHEIGKEIQKINLRVHNISENQSKLGLANVQNGGEPSTSVPRKEKRAPMVEEPDDVVGFKDEAMEVSKMLIEEDAPRSVVSIVGMGGLGKTTLAKKVFNDSNVRRHFSCHAWIYVSQEFKVRDLLCDMIKCISSNAIIDELKNMDEEQLRKELFNRLKGKCYLIVIDDIWSREAWDRLQASFPDENNGSRILLTTRIEDVTPQADPRNKLYRPRLLTNEECWELLCKKAFSEVVNHGSVRELEMIGKKMAKKCYGLPLAAVVLGGLLSRKEQSVHEWEKVHQGISWHLNEGEDQILPILALSYNDLPYYLKMCFLHFAAFPEDFSIPAAELFRMWIAEGFVQQRSDETMEDVAEDYLLELIQRSLIQVAERSFNGRVKKCRIHDLLRDLAIKKAKENQFLDVYTGNVLSTLSTTARRLSVTHGDIGKHISLNHSARHLRSLFWFRQEIIEKARWKSFFLRFKLLRVLHIESEVSMLPDGIGDLIHLRYLSVICKGMVIPSTFRNLRNLHTLIMRGPFGISIPCATWKMRQLRHLQIGNHMCYPLKPKHVILNELTNLQYLKWIEVEHWIESDFDKLTSLRSLGLSGNLMKYQTALSNFIDKIENVESLSFLAGYDSPLPTLIFPSHLRQLKKLTLWGTLEKLPALDNVAHCLTKLVLKWSKLLEDPMAVLEKLPKLQLLKLVDCYLGKKMCCSANGFPMLAVLEIHYCRELEDWTVEEGAIANLRRLEINHCENLKMIPEGIQHVTTLKELVLKRQPSEFRKRVQENELDWFKIQHIPSVRLS